MGLLVFNNRGIYCEQGDFYIDPWKPVGKAIITHGHLDHARRGHKHYLCTKESGPILKLRLGQGISLDTVLYNETVQLNGVNISFHPAGHIIGSAQIRVEYKGEIWVVTGDYKTEDDGFSGSYEMIPCHHFITECTFGLPIYHWEPQEVVFDNINSWWSQNQKDGRVTVLAGYSLGKAQRLIQGVDHSIGKVYTHDAIENTNEVIRASGVKMKNTIRITPETRYKDLKGQLVIAPPGALGKSWTNQFKNFSSGMASGWMAVRGHRRRRAVDRGFVLSDHLDWKGLNQVVEACNPDHIYATHGFTETVAKWFLDQGRSASTVKTLYSGQGDEIVEGI